MKKTRMENFYKSVFGIIIVSLIISFTIVLLFKFSFFHILELKTIDYRFRKSEKKNEKNNDILIISIDDNSLKFFRKNGISWPWPRDFYSVLCDYLTEDGAKLILFDMLFYEPDLNREETDAEYTDGKFAESIKKNGNIILAAKLLKSNEKKILPESLKIFLHHFPNGNNFKGIVLPLDKFLQNAKGIGIINVFPDKDGVIRRVPIFYKLENFFLPQMGITPYLSKNIKIKKKFIFLKSKKIPIDKKGNYFINWYYPDYFKYVTFSSVIQSAFSRDNKSMLPRGFFKDKIILIGSTATGIDDYITVPFSKPVPGVELWATVISNIKNNEYVQKLGIFLNFILIFVSVFLIIFLFVSFQNKFSYLIITIFPIFYVFLSFYLFNKYRLIFPIVPFAFGIVISFLYSSMISYLVEGKSKRELKKIFSRYLHPDVVEEIVNNSEGIKLGGDTIFATVFFSDIANFTTYSEGKKAEDLIKVLNVYFESFSTIILDNKGLLDKYMGDGIMAIFGAPFYIKNHAILACKAALEHKFFSDKINNKASFLHKNTRIGINSGYIVAGNVGSEKKTEYTAIGDDVNLASRLEGVNKIYKTKIIISKSTYELVKNSFVCRELDKLKVKGKNKPTSIYELIDFVEKKDNYQWIKLYEKGLYEYQKGNWDNAIRLFKKVFEKNPDDYPSKLMIERCEKLKIENPNNWNGIITLKTK